MSVNVILILAAVVVFFLLPWNGAVATVAFGAAMWLLREANRRRIAGNEFDPTFRAMLWAAAVLSGLVSIAAGVLTVLVLMDKNSGWGGILLLFTVPICLTAGAGVFVYASLARYRPSAASLAASPPSPAA